MSILNGQTIVASDFTGFLWFCFQRTAPSYFFAPNGQAISRAGNPVLYGQVCPTSTVTITIASPGVITWTAHPLTTSDIVRFSTTGALPTGITANTDYYVVNITTNTFQIATTPGGTAINTTGSQSGTQTATVFTHGAGDGSTTFNLPDLRGRGLLIAGGGTRSVNILSYASNQLTLGGSGILNNNNDFITGALVQYNTTGTAPTGLTTATNYYVVRVSNNVISLATTLANAQNGTVITLTGSGSGTQTLTVTLSARNMGDFGGEENHAISSSEMLAHVHANGFIYGGGGSSSQGSNAVLQNPNTGSFGGNAAMNNMSPFGVLFAYVKAG